MSFLDDVLGAVFMTCIVSAIFYGVTCLQAIYYITSCKGDGKFVKGLVTLGAGRTVRSKLPLAIWYLNVGISIRSLDSLHMGFVLHYGYIALVKQFGIFADLASAPWSLPAAISTNAASDLITRLFFFRRIWFCMSKIVATGMFLSDGSSERSQCWDLDQSGHYYTRILCNDNILGHSDVGLPFSYNWLLGFISISRTWVILTSLGLTTATDLSIASTLCFYLAKWRNSYFAGTRSVIASLLQYTIQTGLLATLWSVGSIVAFVLRPKSDITIIFNLSLSKVYINALLASLNARDSLRKKSRKPNNTLRVISIEDGSNTMPLGAIAQASTASASAGTSRTTANNGNKAIAIQVQADKSSCSDFNSETKMMVLEIHVNLMRAV
ncbi:hypothetical protein SCHPADRAFT_885320 [Schizopora paradoxa]|uniref:DUF6534 domain-containing protein n=1 Tax=Schizopora paradoxa TaxID=27342 RepID=A0A0H2S6Y1_9AGAM|nr:hypothetical protein SCHPADRAFT_885320 [Schizopora paradoxa]